MKSKLLLPQEADLTAEQQEVLAQVLHSRKSANGPFLAWLHSPVLADRAQRLGEFCRYQTSLSACESELLILCVAAHHDCVAEQYFHEPIALAAGLDADAVAAIRAHRVPDIGEARLGILYRMAMQLLARNRLEDGLREQAREALGETAFVEAVGIMGYYALVAYTLNAFEMFPDV